MNIRHCVLLIAAAYFSFLSVSGQKGPGGVTDDSDDQKNCRLWLDAGDLNLADQTDVTLWIDRSVSDVIDEAFWEPNPTILPPIYRNDPSSGINGKAVISFEDGGMLSIGEYPLVEISEDLNSNPNKRTTYQQTIFIVFRTSNDVTSRQILWEEGGATRGFNIQMVNGNVQIGAYDVNPDGPMTLGGGDLNLTTYGPVPAFGYSYKALPIQPNTTYVLSMVYDVSTSNEVLNPGNPTFSGLTGSLNGLDFPNALQNGCCGPPGVGGVYTHPDAIGIGGLNRGSYDENGPIASSLQLTGSSGFTGRLAEICYYAFPLSPCQRIIVENYLSAKYFANVTANDLYDYQTGFGDDVIGIGKENNSDLHNVSQGDNLFEISVDDMSAAFPNDAPYYLLVGHNNSPLAWTGQNVPDTLSIQRLRRIWRFDRTGPGVGGTGNGSRTVHIEIDQSDLIPLPTGFTQYGIIVDNSNGVLPNFSGENLQIIGLADDGSDRYICDVEIEAGSYLTVAAIAPTVNFTLSSISSIEGDNPPSAFFNQTVNIRLNYQPPPAISYEALIDITNGTAIQGSDYNVPSAVSPLNFTGGVMERSFDVQILNDNVAANDNPIEEFYAVITGGTGGLSVGNADSIEFRILDNDPPPKLTFEAANYVFNESEGEIKIPMEIIGTFSGNPSAQISLKSSGNAQVDADFGIISPQTLNFSEAVPRDSVIITLIDDPIDEPDETFGLKILSAVEIGFDDTLNIETEITILDNDAPPTVNFLASSSEGYEGIGDPRIYVVLSAPSAKQIVVPFSALSSGTATNGAVSGSGSDYEAEVNSTLVIPAGDTLSFIYYDIPTDETNFIVNSDLIDEPDESAIFELDPNPVNAQIGTVTQHTYFIRDYVEFENRGVAGVGKDRDNTIVMVADEAINTSNIPNLSPRNIEIIQTISGNQPSLESSSALNNRSVLRFDGTSDFLAVGDPSTPGQSSLINTAGFYDGKSIFMVFTPQNADSSTPQTLYKQGGVGKGLSIFLQDNTLYFQGWNTAAEGDYSPWGASSATLAIVESATPILNDHTYIISAHYLNNMFPGVPDDRGLKLYVNGILEDSYTGDVGRLYSHTGRSSIGAVWNSSLFFDQPVNTGSGFSNFYDGDIAEMIYFNEPNRTKTVRMNEPRINILHNHLSAKYNVPLDPSVQYFDIGSNGNASSPDYFGHDVAGIARVDTTIHGDAKGKAEIRVHTLNFSGTGDFHVVWGHQGDAMTNTWPVSYWNAPIENPIQERSGRIWKFFTDAAPGELTAQIEIDYSESANADSIEPNEDEYLRLLIHTNSEPNDFNLLDTILEPQSSVLDGNTIIFQDVPITDGMYISLGNTSSINNLPLPIELLYFSAELRGSFVDLSWETATELNHDYFVIERAGEDLVWKPLQQVLAAGNSTRRISYKEKDRNPLSGLSYYRLKQVDFDGMYEYSQPVVVLNTTINEEPDVFLFPNPSMADRIYLKLPQRARNFETEVRMFHVSGKLIQSRRFSANSDLLELEYGTLPAGIYLVSIQSEMIHRTKKLVIR